MSYQVIYESSQSGSTGCTHKLAVTVEEAHSAPPAFDYLCKTCTRTHGFHKTTSFYACSPGEIASFSNWCMTKGVEEGVRLTS